MSTSVDVVLLAMSMMLASSLTFIPMHILHLIISLISLASSATLARGGCGGWERLRTSVPHSCPFSFSQLDAHKSKSTQLIYNRFSDTHFPTPCIYKTDAYQETKRTR